MTDTVPVTAHIGAQGSASGPANANTARSYRAVSAHTVTGDHLGPLADLPASGREPGSASSPGWRAPQDGQHAGG
jgi:hypothetical protein